MYVIYEPSSKAAIRHAQITDEAQSTKLLKKPEVYTPVLYHPTEDKAAIVVVNIIPVQLSLGVYTQGVNFEPCFTQNELDRQISDLPPGWWPEAEPE